MKLFLKFYIFFNIINFFKIYSNEFIYPVAFSENIIYIIHQKSLYNIELWLHDIQSNTKQKTLISNFIPADLKLLPDGKAFSFIDKGRLRIKYNHKRSPKTIDFDYPIYNIGSIEWIDNHNCYFSAIKNKSISIFHFNLNRSKMDCLYEEYNSDCIFPQKKSSSLFFIRRTFDKNSNPVKYNYQIVKTDCFTDKNKKKYNEIIVDNKNEPIAFAFLKIISDDEGFFISHQELLNRENNIIKLNYNHFKKIDNSWICKKLFTFELPVNLIFGNNEERLYESILPLLPTYKKGKIYFCSNSEENSLNIFSYNFDTQKIELKTGAKKSEIFFAPVLIDNKILYGRQILLSDQIYERKNGDKISLNYFDI